MSAKEHFEAGRLADAIDELTRDVRQHPTDVSRRGFLSELLCFAGEMERVDAQLDVIQKQDTKTALGVALFRQLVRGETARRQFYREGRLPEFLDRPPPHVQLHLEASIHLREGNAAEAARLLEEAEAARPRVAGVSDGRAFEDMRDMDDVCSCVFEVLTSTGKYYWVPMESVEIIEFRKPERPRDLCWRRAHMVVAGGPDGEVFLPAIYAAAAAASDDRVRLGRVTEWTGGEGVPVQGAGLRSYLVGEEGMSIMELGTVKFARADG